MRSARTIVLPSLTALLGVAIIVRTLTAGAGSFGLLMGVLFLAAGVARLWLERHR
jgi:hypothetical protein